MGRHRNDLDFCLCHSNSRDFAPNKSILEGDYTHGKKIEIIHVEVREIAVPFVDQNRSEIHCFPSYI